MKEGSKLTYLLYWCIPIFLLFALYSQMQSVKVIDANNAILSNSPIKDTSTSSEVGTIMVFVPAIGPYLEVSSISNLFYNMKLIIDENTDKNSSKIFNSMFKSYLDEINNEDPSFYLYQYDRTLKSMLEYFTQYSTLGPDSEVTMKLKESLSNNIKILQILSIGKTILYILLFICGLIGVFVFKGRYSEKSMSKY